MGIVKMQWSITIYFIFVFYYTSGQIIQVPIDKQKLKLNMAAEDPPGIILPLKAKKAVTRLLPSQWEKESEVANRWTNARIPYYLDTNSYDTNVINLLEVAFSYISENDECPEFVKLEEKPRGNTGSWLHFTNPDRVRQCVHDPGLDGNGEIAVVFGYDCLKPAQILHTLLHGLGYRDEVTHPQRDLFVKVMWDNIQPAFRSMFRIHSVDSGALLDYDPKSIMHFHDRAYSLNGQASIAPLLPGLRVEPSGGLSHLDKIKIRLTFGHECKKRQIGKILDSCGRYNDFKNDDNGSNDDGRIVVPGNDVKPEDDTEQEVPSGDGDVVVIPSKDVNIDTENEVASGNEESPSNGDMDVIPGNDVNIDTENEVASGNDESPSKADVDVIPGNDVNIETDLHHEMTSGNDESPNGGDVDVIPGNDVNPGTDTDNEVTGKDESPSGGDVDVIPGKDVNPESDTEPFFKYEFPTDDEVMIINKGGTVNITNGEMWASGSGVSIIPKKGR